MPNFRSLAGCAVMIVVSAQSAGAGAADAQAGRVAARACSVCHGKLGIASDPEVPNLAGQSAFYVEKALNDYRTGAREDRRMTLIAEALAPDAIKDLAAWYESIEVVASVP